MKVVGLISGGKDSLFNLMECERFGHEIIALANLHPDDVSAEKCGDELDSFMFQTVGFTAIPAVAAACRLPLIRRTTKGRNKIASLQYGDNLDPEDEVEDLFQLLQEVKTTFPEVQAVSCGAILSDYQRIRVENVCSRLGLVSLAYLWQRNQSELLDDMIIAGVHAILIKTATMGLEPRVHLGKSLKVLKSHLQHLSEAYGVNQCGEGGEYETFVLDCPLYKEKIVIVESEMLGDSLDSPITPSGHLRIIKTRLEKKDSLLINRSAHGFVHFCGRPGGYDTFEDWIEDISLCGLNLDDAIAVSLYISDMSQFSSLNEKYKLHFSHKPPVRACVQGNCSNFNGDVILCVDPGAIQSHLHVQSISSWAPACIGPYSQTHTVNGLIFMAGMIGLNPQTMEFDPVDLRDESNQLEKCFEHVGSVLSTVKSSSSAIFSTVVYVRSDIDYSFDMNLEHLLVVGVPRLPRDALVEIQCVADEFRRMPPRYRHPEPRDFLIRLEKSDSSPYVSLLVAPKKDNRDKDICNKHVKKILDFTKAEDIIYTKTFYNARKLPSTFPDDMSRLFSFFGIRSSFIPVSFVSIGYQHLLWASQSIFAQSP